MVNARANADLELTTARMLLRPTVADDLDDLVALDSDPEVMRYISGGAPHPRELYERELLPRMLAWPGQPIGFFTALDRGAGLPADPLGEFLGWFHLRPSVADEQILELGYRLRRSAWGRGLATEGAQGLLRRAFVELDQLAVDACALPENAGSIAVMKKCGMTRVGEFIHPRAATLVVRYLVTRAQWLATTGP